MICQKVRMSTHPHFEERFMGVGVTCAGCVTTVIAIVVCVSRALVTMSMSSHAAKRRKIYADRRRRLNPDNVSSASDSDLLRLQPRRSSSSFVARHALQESEESDDPRSRPAVMDVNSRSPSPAREPSPAPATPAPATPERKSRVPMMPPPRPDPTRRIRNTGSLVNRGQAELIRTQPLSGDTMDEVVRKRAGLQLGGLLAIEKRAKTAGEQHFSLCISDNKEEALDGIQFFIDQTNGRDGVACGSRATLNGMRGTSVSRTLKRIIRPVHGDDTESSTYKVDSQR
jgi:hypothetical protein